MRLTVAVRGLCALVQKPAGVVLFGLTVVNTSVSEAQVTVDLPGSSLERAQAIQNSDTAGGLTRWINPATAPFIPVPVVGNDPNSGTTLGVMPTWVHANERGEISRIIAPDFTHNPNFGYGVDGRIFSFPSDNEQWSVMAGIEERVQRIIDLEYQTELARQRRWSTNYTFIYSRDGSPRFFGIGNSSLQHSQTGYTQTLQVGQAQIGFNLSHVWQIQYTFRPERVDVSPASLKTSVSIGTFFPNVSGLGTNTTVSNRIALIYDTRDNVVVPRNGTQLIAYGGVASRTGLLNDTLYREVGLDGRLFLPLTASSILAAHASVRYLLSANRIPFWDLSNIGGDRSVLGGAQELRGFGEGRFYDRNSVSATMELRHTVLSFDAGGSHVDVEATPFIDVGSVFSSSGSDPFARLHKVIGLGLRGVAHPFVVGYVDVGYGNEGIATFTGINYPF